ncbi:FISUMP domain-containing protein [Sunxiuqinia sp. A32]|uniref:FISUMP domain-containing protein n=1 Tax=Sunxiuqinia sp. A32 TaxID=3461496 RepID=UPI00404548A4
MQLEITAEAFDGSITNLNIYIDNEAAESLTSPPYIYTLIGKSLEMGDHTIKVIATDDKSENSFDEIQISLSTTIKDADGNTYRTLKIGDQWWTAENLRTTKYNDGTPIPLKSSSSAWEASFAGAYCWYENDKNTYKDTYGALYNWYAVETEKLCPQGWHVPKNGEWLKLRNYLSANGHKDTEGNALKTTTGWYNDGNGTDDYSFSGIPSGYRNHKGTFGAGGAYADWWTSSEQISTSAWAIDLIYGQAGILQGGGYKECGYSVRCIKN